MYSHRRPEEEKLEKIRNSSQRRTEVILKEDQKDLQRAAENLFSEDYELFSEKKMRSSQTRAEDILKQEQKVYPKKTRMSFRRRVSRKRREGLLIKVSNIFS